MQLAALTTAMIQPNRLVSHLQSQWTVRSRSRSAAARNRIQIAATASDPDSSHRSTPALLCQRAGHALAPWLAATAFVSQTRLRTHRTAHRHSRNHMMVGGLPPHPCRTHHTNSAERRTRSHLISQTSDAASRRPEIMNEARRVWESPGSTVGKGGHPLGQQVLWTGPGDVAQAQRAFTADETNTIQLFKKSTPAVVYITNFGSRRDQFTMDMQDIPQGAGSGTIWDSEGHIVTNYHVVKDASELLVSLTDGFMTGGPDEFKAKLVGYDADKDLAVLKIDVPDNSVLRPLPQGESADLVVGQKVYAIGNPFGLDHSLTTGVISGMQREISSGINGRPIQGVVQIDAAINPGNSGGPLLDSGGDLIGINTAIYSPSGANAGVGFAVPIDILKSSVSQIIKFGKVVRPILGIAFAPEQSVEQLGVQGILVLDARRGGPAQKAGVQGTSRDNNGRLVLGDIITRFNGKIIKTASDLYKQLDLCKVGDEAVMEVLRDTSKEQLRILLEASS